MLNSNLYTESVYNPCSGISTIVYETFIVDLSTANRVRVVRLHPPVPWVRD